MMKFSRTLAMAGILVGVGLGTPVQAQGFDTGNYVKFELGAAFDASGDAYWQPPGYPADPEVHFDLSADNGIFVSAAVGRSYGNGFRGDVALSIFGERDFSGAWSSTIPATPGPHADISAGSVRSTALMFNGYWSPFDMGAVQPFVTAGLGLANNKMSDWTRTNAAAARVNRTFEGASNTDFAWSIGFGVTGNLNKSSAKPVMFEATYRYFDLGTAMGSGTPLPGNGASSPVMPLQYEQRDHVVSVGIRIPLGGS